MTKMILKNTMLILLISATSICAKNIKINEQEIQEKEIVELSKNFIKKDYNNSTEEEKEEIIKSIIDMQIVLNEAREIKLDEKQGYKETIDYLKKIVLIQLYTEDKYNNFKISEDELKEYYDKNKEAFQEERIVDTSHILLETEERAQGIINKLNKSVSIGVAFEELAKKHSVGPSNVNGGKLGWVARNEMIKPFEDATFKLKKGEYTKKPVKTKFGYHVIYANDIKIVKKRTYEDFKNQIKINPQIIEEYKQELFNKYLANELKKLKKNKYKINIME